MGEAWSPLRNMALIWSSGKKSPLYHSFQQWLCRNEYQKMVSFTSQYCNFLTPQSSDRLFASLLYTVAKTEASLTCLCFFETARGACGNGLEWLQRCAEEPAPWPKASQLASSPVTGLQVSGKWCSSKNCWGQQLKSVVCWVFKYFPPGHRQKLPR